ncbi:hypothetical protein FGIG_07746 [Fasciola gigantica]|uniref:Uncharacterized protein n=1 Tax=Fasciola gigantica TaxID=46835 RepID=A0A504YD43_FASGI|nr:hypothetical protein FGIG_07746 [Fasciola gigantica]
MALFSAFHLKGMPQKFVNLLRSLYSCTSDRVRVNGAFEMTSGVRQGCPISLFSFDFIMNETMENTLRNLQDVSVKLGSSEKLCDYAGDLVCLFGCAEHALRALDRLAKAEAIRHALCTFKV